MITLKIELCMEKIEKRLIPLPGFSWYCSLIARSVEAVIFKEYRKRAWYKKSVWFGFNFTETYKLKSVPFYPPSGQISSSFDTNSFIWCRTPGVSIRAFLGNSTKTTTKAWETYNLKNVPKSAFTCEVKNRGLFGDGTWPVISFRSILQLSDSLLSRQ